MCTQLTNFDKHFQLGEWKAFLNNGFTFKVLPLTFPSDNPLKWKKLFKPCAAQRLFLPVSINHRLHNAL